MSAETSRPGPNHHGAIVMTADEGRAPGAALADGEDPSGLEQRAAAVRLRLMQTMDALGHKRHELAEVSERVMQRGTRYAALAERYAAFAGVAVVVVAGLAAGLAAYRAVDRAHKRTAARIWGLVPALQWRRPELPAAPEEPSLFSRLATRAFVGLATAVLKTVFHRLAAAHAEPEIEVDFDPGTPELSELAGERLHEQQSHNDPRGG